MQANTTLLTQPFLPAYYLPQQADPFEGSENPFEDKPYMCQICHVSYSQKSRLQIHLRKHLGIKPYECKFCGNRFTEKGNLNVHLKSHFGQRNYSCEICSQQFITKGHLEDHVRRHNKERKFKCDECGSEFYRTTQLKNHLKNKMRCIKSKLNREYEEKFFQGRAKINLPQQDHFEPAVVNANREILYSDEESECQINEVP